MELNPQTIFEEYCNKLLDKSSATNLLISIVENYEEDIIRADSINILDKINLKDGNLFNFFENLLLSDFVRNASANYIGKNYLNNTLTLFEWALQHETSNNCLITVIKYLVKMNSRDSKLILIEQLKKIKKIQFLSIEKGFENKKYKKLLKSLLKTNRIKNFTTTQLAEILINYLTIKHLIDKIPNVYFELDPNTLLVEKLDLSDYLEFEVRGTPWDWKNNIREISEISGLHNLNYLKILDLSNNQIKNVKGLIKLKNLTHLILSNNKISDSINLKYLKQLPKLQYLDLYGNSIVEVVKNDDFNPNIRVLLKRDIE
jgi:Leucine-rich repeat (LRR) protein